MKKEEIWQEIKQSLRYIIGIALNLAGIILVFFLLLLWAEHIPTNPPDQYKTSVVFRGKTVKEIQYEIGFGNRPRIQALRYLRNSSIPCGFTHKGKTFVIEVENIQHKEAALEILQDGIDKGIIIVDKQNFLVTE